jgi:hypothetical protein
MFCILYDVRIIVHILHCTGQTTGNYIWTPAFSIAQLSLFGPYQTHEKFSKTHVAEKSKILSLEP